MTEYTAKFLAQLLHGTVEGDENAQASQFAKIEHGKPGTLSFFANPKYEEYVYTSQASILIVNQDFQPKQPVKATLVRVPNAYTAITELLKYESAKKQKARRYRSWRARWHFSTHFGKKGYLGAYSYVGRHVKIGDGLQLCGPPREDRGQHGYPRAGYHRGQHRHRQKLHPVSGSCGLPRHDNW